MPKIWIHQDEEPVTSYHKGKSTAYYSANVPQKTLDDYERARSSYYDAQIALEKAYNDGLSEKDKEEIANRPKFWGGISSGE